MKTKTNNTIEQHKPTPPSYHHLVQRTLNNDDKEAVEALVAQLRDPLSKSEYIYWQNTIRSITQNNKTNAGALWLQGLAFQRGLGCSRNYTQARHCYKQAADLYHFAPAQYKLGEFYELGLDVPPNLNLAWDHYKRAADQKYAPAVYNYPQNLDHMLR